MPHPLAKKAAIRFAKQVSFFKQCTCQELFAFIEKTKEDPKNRLFKYTDEEIKLFEAEGRQDLVQASIEMQAILAKYIESDQQTQALIARINGTSM